MQAKNYTNPQDRGRFGFSMSGEYRAPYKSESVLVAILIGVAVGAGVALFFIMMSFVEKSKREAEDTAAFVIIATAIALMIFAAILIAIFGVGIRSVKKGFLCKYTANDETFTATVGGDLHVIQYSEVTNVNFQPRSSLGKIRGYDVTVRVNGRDEEFSICSDGYLSPKSTPFYIIQERIDIMRRSQNTVQVNTAKANTGAITRASADRATKQNLTAMDRMAQLLGETSNMPELSVEASPTERAVAEVDKLMNSYPNADMPSVGAKQSNPFNANTYVDESGREHSINSTLAQGSFYVKPDPRVWVAFIIGVTMLSGALFVFLWNVAGLYTGMLPTPLYDIVFIVLFLIVLWTAFFNSATKTRSPVHNYKADGRGFYVTVKGQGKEQILYKDVLSVDYSPMKFLWGSRGYKVDILTTYGVVHFDYLFPRFNHRIILQNLPFDIIKRNIPKRDEN